MKDGYGRDINYARISLTDLCNYRCTYCMAESGVEKKSHGDMLTLEDFRLIIEALAECGISKVRFTGGEPLVKKGAVDLIEEVSKIDGIKQICLTTNGYYLPQYAERLKAAGVSGVNISIDSLNEATFASITRNGNLCDALNGLEAALNAGFENVKVNSVLMRAINDAEVKKFAEFGAKKGVMWRMIELMPFSNRPNVYKQYAISVDEILKRYPELTPISEVAPKSGTAEYYTFADGAKIGFIRPLSHKFCAYCNRIRVTADGKLLLCLHESKEYDLKPHCDSKQELVSYVQSVIRFKPECHRLESGDTQIRDMNAIGG